MTNFEESHKQMGMPFIQEAVPYTSGVLESSPVAEITTVVRNLFSSEAARGNEISTEMSKALSKVGVMWL